MRETIYIKPRRYTALHDKDTEESGRSEGLAKKHAGLERYIEKLHLTSRASYITICM